MATTTAASDWGLILVDPQKDLVLQTGASAVPEAETLLPVWTQLVTAARQAQAAIVVLANDYPPDTPAFSERGLLPHCVQGTPGAELVHEIAFQGSVINPANPEAVAELQQRDLPLELIVSKQSPDVWQQPLMEHVLEKYRHQGVQAWVVAGVAMDSAVKATVLGLRSREWGTYLLADAIKGATDSGTVKALEEMEQAGASLIESATTIIHWKKAATPTSVPANSASTTQQ